MESKAALLALNTRRRHVPGLGLAPLGFGPSVCVVLHKANASDHFLARSLPLFHYFNERTQ